MVRMGESWLRADVHTKKGCSLHTLQPLKCTPQTLIHRKPFQFHSVNRCTDPHSDYQPHIDQSVIHQSNCYNFVLNLSINNFLSCDSLALETGVRDEAALRLYSSGEGVSVRR